VGASRDLGGLVRTVNDATVGQRNAVLFWAGCRLAEREAGAADAAGGRELLREAALAAGLGEAEVERTLDSALTASRGAA